MTKATARWSGSKTRFSIEAGSGHQALVDEAAPFSDDEGMRPTEMLLGALGGCTGVNAVLLLRKFQQRFQNLAIQVEGDQEADWPRAFSSIRINFEISWEDGFTPDEVTVEKALDMACNRYCPVDATLTDGTRIQHSHSSPAR
ncbi:MAG: OsmC family protein [Candidatus Dormibacteraeota bacterium]|nr:OsmC family protein [Candidatus Dormibacteraeota bacterium]